MSSSVNVICVVFVVILVSLMILVCVIIEVYGDPVVCEVIVVALVTLLCRGTLNWEVTIVMWSLKLL